MVDVQTLLEAFLNMPVPLMKLFSGGKQTFQSWDYFPKSQIIGSAELSDIGLRELRHT